MSGVASDAGSGDDAPATNAPATSPRARSVRGCAELSIQRDILMISDRNRRRKRNATTSVSRQEGKLKRRKQHEFALEEERQQVMISAYDVLMFSHLQNTPAPNAKVAVWQDEHTQDFVSVGDVIMVSPDEEGRATDAKSGFVLGVNLGEVLDIIGDDVLKVGWLWSDDTTWEASRWIEWRAQKTKQRYIDTVWQLLCSSAVLTIWQVHVSKCLATTWGVFAKVKLEKCPKGHRKRIDKECLKKTVLPVVHHSSTSASS